jgi:L-amino acid N-acyltransferase
MQRSNVVSIRRATQDDAKAIADIYNDAVINTVATFDTETRSIDERLKWLNDHDSRHPVLIAEMDGSVAGWASLSRWSDRKAYDDTAEVSMYIRAQDRDKGVGKELSAALIEEGRNAGLHTIIARIVEGNGASVHLCETLGFIHIGTMKEAGNKFGRRLDVHMMQKIYS